MRRAAWSLAGAPRPVWRWIEQVNTLFSSAKPFPHVQSAARAISDHFVYSDCVEAGAQITQLGLALKCWEVGYIYVEWYRRLFFPVINVVLTTRRVHARNVTNCAPHFANREMRFNISRTGQPCLEPHHSILILKTI